MTFYGLAKTSRYYKNFRKRQRLKNTYLQILMRSRILSTLMLLVLVFTVDAQKIISYSPYYRTFPAGFDFSLYTHVHFFAVWPDSTGNLLWPGQNDSSSLHQKYQMIQERMGADQKLLITFGGTSAAGSKYFSQMAGDSTSLENFVQNATRLCLDWGAHGIDIDWEWGQKLEPDDVEKKSTYEKLMIRLRQRLDEEGLLLSTAVSASGWFGDNYPVEGVQQADYVNVMTYTYNGAWSSTANHHAPLSKTESIGLSYWKNRGIMAAKLNLGVPFYGHNYSGAGAPGESFNSFKTLTYPEVKHHMDIGYLLNVDTLNGSYCSYESSIIFFDHETDLSAKVNHVKALGYHGIFIWEIGQDDEQQSLSRAIYESMYPQDPTSLAVEKRDQNFRILYSPASGIELFSETEEPFSAQLYSLDGKQVAVSPHNFRQAHIQSQDLPSGIYIVRIRSGERVSSKKIILGRDFDSFRL